MEEKVKKAFLNALLIALTASVGIGVLILIFGSMSEFETKLLGTSFTFVGFSFTALWSAALFEKHKEYILGQVGIVVSMLGFVYTLCCIWFASSYTLTFLDARMMLILMTLSAGIAHASYMLVLKPVNKLVLWVVYATLAVITVFTGLVIFLIVYEGSSIWNDGTLFRAIAAFLLLDVLGTIMAPVLNRVNAAE